MYPRNDQITSMHKQRCKLVGPRQEIQYKILGKVINKTIPFYNLLAKQIIQMTLSDYFIDIVVQNYSPLKIDKEIFLKTYIVFLCRQGIELYMEYFRASRAIYLSAKMCCEQFVFDILLYSYQNPTLSLANSHMPDVSSFHVQLEFFSLGGCLQKFSSNKVLLQTYLTSFHFLLKVCPFAQ